MVNEDEQSHDAQGEPAPGTKSTPPLSSQRILIVGAVVVGIWALFSLGSTYTDTAGIALLAVLLVGVVLLVPRDRPPAATAGILVILSSVVAVLALLEVLEVLSNLDRLDDFGGVVGLIGFVFYLIGGSLMLWAALQEWRSSRIVIADESVHPAEHLVLIGALVVVVAWMLMMLAPAWVLVGDQAIGIAAATAAGVLVQLRRTGSSPFSTRVARIGLVAASVVAVVMAFYSLTYVIPDWEFLVEFGGVRTYVPYLIYLVGGAVLGVAGVRLFLLLRGGWGVNGSVAAVIGVLLGLAVFSLGRGGDREATAADTPSTTQATEPVAAAEPVAPDIAPIDACFLLTQFEAFEALGVGYDDQATYHDTGFGPLREGGRGEMVTESCKWVYYPDPQAWENDEEHYIALLSPGDPTDFEPGAASPWEPAAGAGVAVRGIGAAAIWFPGTDAGLLSVIQETPWGLAFLRTGVGQPDLDDETRLEIASGLAARTMERLVWGPYTPLEMNLCDLLTTEEAEEVFSPYRQGRLADAELFGPDSVTVDLTRFGMAAGSCEKLLDFDISIGVGQGVLTGDAAAAGEPLPGVGDQAVWFPDSGILNVRSGDVGFRIDLAVPDAPTEEQLGVATRLATRVLNRLGSGGVTVSRDTT